MHIKCIFLGVDINECSMELRKSLGVRALAATHPKIPATRRRATAPLMLVVQPEFLRLIILQAHKEAC
jgi:hypothetical protein